MNILADERLSCAITEKEVLKAMAFNYQLRQNISQRIDISYFNNLERQSIFNILVNIKNTINSVLTNDFILTAQSLQYDAMSIEKFLYEFQECIISKSAINDIDEKDFYNQYIKRLETFAKKRAYAQYCIDTYSSIVGEIEDKKIDDIASSSTQKLLDITKNYYKDEKKSNFNNIMDGVVEEIVEKYFIGSQLSGISTGFHDIDRKIGGLAKSDLIILAGRPSMGKTSLATNMAFEIAKKFSFVGEGEDMKITNGGRVLFFSLEMSKAQLAQRIISDFTNIKNRNLKIGDLNAIDFETIRSAKEELNDIPLYIEDTGVSSLDSILQKSREHKQAHNIDVIFIDYLQLMSRENLANFESRVQELTKITMSLKSLAKELDIPIVALSQLSREVEKREDKKPQLSDLRDSGSIEQDADIVMFVYREEYYLSRKEPKEGTPAHAAWEQDISAVYNKANVIVGKNRHGDIGDIILHFDAEKTKFSNYTERDEEWN